MTLYERIIIFLFIIHNQYISPYICAAHLLVQKETGQSVVILSDYHLETKASIIQRKEILDAAKHSEAFLLVEDNGYRCAYATPDEVVAYPSCFQSFLDDLVIDPVHFDPNRKYDADFSLLDMESNSEKTPLLLLTSMARVKEINTKTVECRQAEKISAYNGPISAAQVCQVYDCIVNQIAHYNDDACCNEFYQEKLNEYYMRCNLVPQFFKYLRSCEGNLKKAFKDKRYEHEVLNAYKKSEYQNYINDFVEQGAQLDQAKKMASGLPIMLPKDADLYSEFFMIVHNFMIDTIMVHEVVTHKDQPIIIAYCGDWHARVVNSVLQADGFELKCAWDAREKVNNNALNIESYFEKINKYLDQSQKNYQLARTALQEINTCNKCLDLLIGNNDYYKNLLPWFDPCALQTNNNQLKVIC